jgi:quercetin dioxygenase-like cupin family protein
MLEAGRGDEVKSIVPENSSRRFDIRRRKKLKRKRMILGISILFGIGTLWGAQQAGFKRTVLQQGDASAPGWEYVTAEVEFQPGAEVGRHSHPGDEIGYVLEGTVVLTQDGKPAVTLGPGKAFHIPAGTIHNATNSGSKPARILATYIVGKGKPLAMPVLPK